MFNTNLFATHAKAAEIIYKHMEGYLYEISIITITYSPSPADRPELQIIWGDGTNEVLPRHHYIDLESTTRKNYYIGQHTFPGEGSYLMSMEDPNRNYGIVNIPNSVNQPLYVESLLVINDEAGPNNSPEFPILPYSYVKVNQSFHFNCGAIDWDGDHLAYQLVDCKGLNGLPIPGYQLPAATNEFSLNNENGQILWDYPYLQGEYVIAVKITEWRNGSIIGFVVREFQFAVDAFSLNVPEIVAIEDTAIYYNHELDIIVSAVTSSNESICLNAYGYPFLIDNQAAEFDSVYGFGNCSSVFHWETIKQHARSQPYYIYLVSHTYEGLIRCTTIKPLKIFINFYEDINESQTLNKAGVSMNTLVDHKLLVRFNNQYDENITIRIFSLSGTCVALFNTLITPSRTLEVDLSNLNSSIYIVKFENGNQVIYSGKIVKQ